MERIYEWLNVAIVVQLLSRAWLFATPMDCSPSGSSVQEIIHYTAMRHHFLLQNVVINDNKFEICKGLVILSSERPKKSVASQFKWFLFRWELTNETIRLEMLMKRYIFWLQKNHEVTFWKPQHNALWKFILTKCRLWINKRI